MRALSIILLQLLVFSTFAFSHGKPTLLVFSGSDWCIPCINFEKNILSTDKFKSYSSTNLVLVKADFPQHKQLSKEQVSKNESLAERYNPQGIFPYVLLLDENGTVLKRLNTSISDPQLLINEIENAAPKTVLKEYRKKRLLMGSSFEFSLVHYDENIADSLLNACIEEVQRIELLISEWDPKSEVSEVNRMAGIEAVEVSSEVYQLFDRSLTLSELSKGAFDISFRGINLYSFDKKEHKSFPDSAMVKNALTLVGYKNVLLNPGNKVMLKNKGMAVGFGASGKGYAADQVKQMMIDAGVTGGVINASGDLTCWGTRADGDSWRVGIANPEKSTEMQYWLPVVDGAVATSGSYEKYFIYNGVHYSHIINPLSGYPISDKLSVTVFSKSAELSDALATALFVLPIDRGLALVESLPNVKALIIDTNNKTHRSKNLQLVE